MRVVRATNKITTPFSIYPLFQAGYGTAHDEYVPFRIQGDALFIRDYKLAFTGDVQVEFVKVLMGFILTFSLYLSLSHLSLFLSLSPLLPSYSLSENITLSCISLPQIPCY